MTYVLLVDDHEDGRDVLAEWLSVSGFQVEGCASGEDALMRIAERGRPDVVLTDLTLGAMSGVELARQLRDRDATIPVLAVTGHVNYNDPDRLFTEVLPKPVVLPRLVASVKKAIETR